jgi:hypothetical protein
MVVNTLERYCMKSLKMLLVSTGVVLFGLQVSSVAYAVTTKGCTTSSSSSCGTPVVSLSPLTNVRLSGVNLAGVSRMELRRLVLGGTVTVKSVTFTGYATTNHTVLLGGQYFGRIERVSGSVDQSVGIQY